ncbi:hypothetical protein PUNSTDRAFT_52658 [Punctularia strigosozonata HHB-11173 SS5]|uniref:uncharacterized protein n=1 Tax=Punctularia strigosozonata (strain HHB-11173) TaxID=741275 RepID=UPI000441627B|nr:uncharacterized protein PUNSTDRAFT_52658 [Punctularia strigosozonata HHB-11173 SS5]EIN08198.1 hypothetical protein PUNSTDRAFT_52658 [Punctularia strigosozonata HHB-11173 SS5]
MTSAPTNPLEIPPYQLQSLIASVAEQHGAQVRCVQALGPEIYAGCSNGELLRFALEKGDQTKSQAYTLLSRQNLPGPAARPIDDIVLVGSIARALILSGNQVHFYTLPSLDPVQTISPLRNVVTFTVDEQHLRRPPLNTSSPANVEPVDLCIIKRTSITLYQLRERLLYQKDIPLPQGATVARRIGRHLCVADKEFYNMINLEEASLFPFMPISQAPDSGPIKPLITVIGENEFLVVSWTGASAMGVFITGDGDPLRGTLTWPSHPEAISLDYPYIVALLPNQTIEIHNIETQGIVQVISPPASASPQQTMTTLSTSAGRYLVPSRDRTTKMRMTNVKLIREPIPLPAKPKETGLPEVTPV